MARRTRFSDESGLAIIVALLVTLISFIVVSAVLAQALHNVSQAGYLRRRVTAVNAAEAGLNWYWKTLEKTSLASLSSGDWSRTVVVEDMKDRVVWEYTGSDVASAPDKALFRLRVRYVKENPCVDPSTKVARACSSKNLNDQPLDQDPFPATVYAIVRSIGCVGPASVCWDASKPGVRRALETVMRLRSRYGGVSGSVTASYVCLDEAGKLTMSGDLFVMGAPMTGPPGWPADCAAGVVVGSGDELTMTGNLYAGQGDLAVGDGGTMTLTGDVWAKDQVILGDGAQVEGATCTTSGVKICVKGNATGSAVSIGSQAAVEGQPVICSPACPPTVLDFPQITWDANDWKNWVIYDNQTAASAVDALKAPASRAVYHVTDSGCVISLSGEFQIDVDVAIVGECRFEMDGGTTLKGSGTLILMSAWPSTAGGPSPLTPAQCGGDNITDPTNLTQKKFVPGPRDIYMHNNPDTSGPNIFFYTPCSLKIDNNQNPVKGQLVARFLWIKNRAEVSLISVSGGGGVSLPGLVSGFSQDVRYINEIPVGTALA